MHPLLRHIYYYSQGGGESYDTDYQAILDRGTTLGYALPSSGQRSLGNALVVALKAAGVWTSLDVFYVFATDGDSDFATINWKSPSTFQITKAGGLTFTADEGFTGNGSTGYLDSVWDAATNGSNYTQNEAGIFVYCNNNVARNGESIFGAMETAGTQTLFNPRNASDQASWSINQTAANVPASADSTGLWHLKRTASNAIALFRNGSSFSTTTTASSALSNEDFCILAARESGTVNRFSTKQASCFGIGASLHGKEAALNTAWNTYFTSL